MVELPVVRSMSLAAPVITGGDCGQQRGRGRDEAHGDCVGGRRPGQAAQPGPLGAGRVQSAEDGAGAERADEPAIGGAGAVEGVGVDGRDAAVIEMLAPAARSENDEFYAGRAWCMSSAWV